MNKQQLAAKLWASANKMRSKIEANEYKDYILGFIFYKFLSDNEVQHLKEKAYWSDEDIKNDLNDQDKETVRYCQDNLGYFISYDNLFSTWLSIGVDFSVSNVTDALNAFTTHISSEPNKRRVFKDIFKTLSDGITKLGGTPADRTKAIRRLIKLIKDIPTDGSQDYDVLGFIYEYLIENFAANAGKKAGEFYTPHEVSLLMSEIVAAHLKDLNHIDIYDPTSGSGSLLINIGRAVAKYMKDKSQVKYFAQELKENTFNLTRMNLVMRGIDADNILVRCGDTLEDDWPFFEESEDGKIVEGTYSKKTVDAVVSNPPYSQSWDPRGKKEDPRFKDYGLAPKSKADYAFLLHDLCHINDGGIVTIVLPHGVLFRPGDDYNIRKNLIDNNNIDAIIGLPADIFYGTGIATLIMVLKRHRDNTDVLIVDASRLSVKDVKKNKLTASDIRRIADTVINRTEVPKFSRLVSRKTIREDNDYNLNIPRYVDSSDAPETWDAYATMFGGIPNHEIDMLANYWKTFPSLRDNLFFPKEGTPCSELATEAISNTIQNNADVIEWKEQIEKAIESLPNYLRERLIGNMFTLNVHREESILADNIYQRLDRRPLLDRYNAYQILDNQWTQIYADIEMLQTEGFQASKVVEPNMVVKKSKNENDIEVQKGWKGHILPFNLVQQNLLCDDLKALHNKREELNVAESRYSELMQELPDEDKETYLNDDNSDFNIKRVTEALCEVFADIKIGKIVLTEKNVSQQILKHSLWEKLAEGSTEFILAQVAGNIVLRKMLKSDITLMEKMLHEKTKVTIENLSDEEARTLLYEKWIRPLQDNLLSIPEIIIERLATKVLALVAKYETGLVEVEQKIVDASNKLSTMLDELIGSDFDMQACSELKNTLANGVSDVMKFALLEKMFPKEGKTTPQIRFKGFYGEWVQRLIGDCFNERKERSGNGELISVTINAGIKKAKELDRTIHIGDTSNYKVVKEGDIAYNSMRMWQGASGYSPYEGILSPAYTVIIPRDTINSLFFAYLFKTLHMIHTFEINSQGLTSDTWNLKYNQLKNISVQYPSDENEQQKIASFFSTFDTLLSAQEQRVSKLRSLKKSFLEKMFVSAQ